MKRLLCVGLRISDRGNNRRRIFRLAPLAWTERERCVRRERLEPESPRWRGKSSLDRHSRPGLFEHRNQQRPNLRHRVGRHQESEGHVPGCRHRRIDLGTTLAAQPRARS